MDHTLEVRWFYPGSPPASVVDWITEIGAEQESERTDLYLVSDDPAMNVKLREGKIQTKHRIGETVSIHFATENGETVSGQRERWVKWSFPLNGTHELHDHDPTGLWVPVHKKRLQREVDDDDQADLLDTLVEDNPTDAAIELTQVTANGASAWTICVESEGRPDGLPGTLRQMGDHLLQDIPQTLERDASYGYASWIQDVS